MKHKYMPRLVFNNYMTDLPENLVHLFFIVMSYVEKILLERETRSDASCVFLFDKERRIIYWGLPG